MRFAIYFGWGLNRLCGIDTRFFTYLRFAQCRSEWLFYPWILRHFETCAEVLEVTLGNVIYPPPLVAEATSGISAQVSKCVHWGSRNVSININYSPSRTSGNVIYSPPLTPKASQATEDNIISTKNIWIRIFERVMTISESQKKSPFQLRNREDKFKLRL